MKLFYSLSLIFYILLNISNIRCDIYELDSTTIYKQEPIVRRVVAMYSPEDAPTSFSVGDGLSSIQVHLNFNASGYVPSDPIDASMDDAFVEVVILAASDLNDIGYIKDGKVISYCCSPEFKELGVSGCNQEGRLIVRGSNYVPYLVPIKPNGHGSLTYNSSHFDVTLTSEHLLIVGYCRDVVGESVEFSGVGQWRNPFGWLPGRLYGFLPFYGYMLILYAVITALWFSLYLKHRTEIAPVQQIISVVLTLTLTEMAAWFADYYSFNSVGRRHVGIVSLSILLSVTRLTISRVLVVAVALGYGVTKPTLGSDKFKLIAVGFLYWVSELSLELVLRYSQTNVVAEHWRVSLSLPVAVLNALFYWWIFVSLQATMDELQQEAQTYKLTIYKQFTSVLIFSLIAAVIFSFYQIYFMTTHQFVIHWSYLWLLDGGFSSFIYTLILCMIIAMWRPTEDSQKYAYSELTQMNQLDHHENGIDDENEFGQLELGAFNNGHHNPNNGPDMPDSQDEEDQDNDHDEHTQINNINSAKFTVNEE